MTPWTDVFVLIVLTCAGALVNYGILKGSLTAQVKSLSEKMLEIKQDVASFVTRTEYESRHKDLRENLSRIEGKLDNLMSRS